MRELLNLLRDALADRYEVDREIGRGGMAVVYLAHDLKHRRRVALKVLLPDLSASLGAERFLREIEIAAQLTHPHVLALYESGEVDGLLYYVTPYLEGGSLRDRLRRERRLPVAEAVRIGIEVAEALAHAHAQGVVHRDIKPENILLASGHACVADFGIARAVRHAALDAELTQPGFPLGTPAYMSPEQAGGEPAVDRRSDVYSLGCVLYEMLAGAPPFGGGRRQVVATGERREPAPPLRLLRPAVPPAVQRVVDTAIAELPEDRFASAAEFANRLAAASRAHERKLLRAGWTALALVTVFATTFVTVRWWPVWAGAAERESPGAIVPAAPVENGAPSVGVIVLPFDDLVGTGEASGPYAAAQQLFTAGLEGLPSIRVLDGAELLGAARSSRQVPLTELRAGAQRLRGRYVAVGAVTTGRAAAAELRVDVYAVDDGRRLVRSSAPLRAAGLDGAAGRVALDAIRAIAAAEGLLTEDRRVLLSSTRSALALVHLLQGQRRFREMEHDAAAEEYRRAIEADSSCALAYHRLSVAHVWRHDFPAALGAVEAGLARRAELAPEWIELLEAQRHYVRREGSSAIALFQSSVQDRPANLDGWLGLGESLFHFGWFTGHRSADARQALETLVRLDSTFAPIDDHLVDLAFYRGDSVGARRALARLRADDRQRAPREAVLAMKFGDRTARAAALTALPGATRYTLSEIVAILMPGGRDVALADTIAGFLTDAGRTPDDRLRGAQYRLVTGAILGRWPERLADWRRVAPDTLIDGWLTQAYFAGYPVGAHVAPMFERARVLVAAGGTPDTAPPFPAETRDAILLLVHRAVRDGDSADVGMLRRTLERVARRADPSDPVPAAARASLDARLALLARDTASAIRLLGDAVARLDDPFTIFYPLGAMAPERVLLAELLTAGGRDAAAIRRWTDSFLTSRNVADHFFVGWSRRTHARAEARRRP